MDLYSFFWFFWTRQLTDRAILAIRQTQEKKTPSAHAPHNPGFLGSKDINGDNKWICIFWGQEHVGPADRDQWRDHDMWRLWGRVVGFVCVSVRVCGLGVCRWVKVLSCHGVGAVHWIFFFIARAGLGSSWVARRNTLPMDLFAPLLTVDVTLHSCLVPQLTLLGLEPMLHSAPQMEYFRSAWLICVQAWQAWGHPG